MMIYVLLEEKQHLEMTKDKLSTILKRAEQCVDTKDGAAVLELEDLRERVSFVLTELAFLTDYTETVYPKGHHLYKEQL